MPAQKSPRGDLSKVTHRARHYKKANSRFILFPQIGTVASQRIKEGKNDLILTFGQRFELCNIFFLD